MADVRPDYDDYTEEPIIVFWKRILRVGKILGIAAPFLLVAVIAFLMGMT